MGPCCRWFRTVLSWAHGDQIKGSRAMQSMSIGGFFFWIPFGSPPKALTWDSSSLGLPELPPLLATIIETTTQKEAV